MSHEASHSLFSAFDVEGRGGIRPDLLLQVLADSGLQLEDPRLATLRERLQAQGGEFLDLAGFESLLDGAGQLLERARKGELIIPDFSGFRAEVGAMFERVAKDEGGRVADYIPQLARVSGEHFAVAVCTIDGQTFEFGDAEEQFTLQSSCKPLLYCAALEELGQDKVHAHVGREPSGLSFNELSLNPQGLPHNPMINAGAIMTSSLIRRDLATADRLEFLSNLVTSLSGGERCHFNSAVWHSERETADRNFALAHHMRERGAFPEGISIPPTLDFYFSACSIEVTSIGMAAIGATLANGGVSPKTGVRVFDEETVKNGLSMMYSCGMYDYSGEFAFSVGIPAKSSVSGAILAVIPNVMGIAVWSPRLDSCGNSVRGVEFLRKLVDKYSFHNYDSLVASRKKDPRRPGASHHLAFTFRAIQAASVGDVEELKRLTAYGHDLNTADYDGRTPLHLACEENRVEAVRYLLDQGVNTSPKDRWGNTPLGDARKKKLAGVRRAFAERSRLREAN